MSGNRMLTANEVAKELEAMLSELPAKVQACFIYDLQTRLGGFPRDKVEEARILAMPDSL